MNASSANETTLVYDNSGAVTISSESFKASQVSRTPMTDWLHDIVYSIAHKRPSRTDALLISPTSQTVSDNKSPDDEEMDPLSTKNVSWKRP